MSMQYQTHLTRGQPDDEAIKLIQYYEPLALEYDPRGYCVCTSEGKDSRVLGHLFRRSGVKHFYLHNITGIDPPELVYFQRRNFQKYQDAGYLTYDVMYDLSMWRMMLKEMYPPMRHMRYCCKHLKERTVPEQGQAIRSFGVRKYESTRRAAHRDELEVSTRKQKIIAPWDNDEARRTFETCYQNNTRAVNPLAHWPDAYIWDYSQDVHLEQCCLYCEGFDRLGCIGCPMAGEQGRERQFERWPEFKHIYIKTFDRMIQARIAAGKTTSFANGQEWFDWWMSDKVQDVVDENQLILQGYLEEAA